MINTITLPREEKGRRKGSIKAPVSSYRPSRKEKDTLVSIIQKFDRSYGLMRKTYRQFNHKSLLTLQDECQKLFLNYRESQSNDPDFEWQSNAIRPIVRNRAISIAAHLTRQVIQPNVVAQNDQQVIDAEAAMVMQELMEYANNESEYDRKFLYAVVSAIVNPAVVIHTEYCNVYRKVKEVGEDGSWEEKEVLDEENSGFVDTIVPVEELYIADFFQHDIQKQPYLIWRRAINYEDAVQKYCDNKNFKYVKPGIQVMFDSDTDTFYESHDPDLNDNLVDELIFYSKGSDLQLRVVGGVLMDDPETPNPRLDKKYPFIKSGYELIDEGKFFYYFSLVRKMKDDAEIINRLYQMIIDGTYLKVMPPQAIYGDEIISTSVIYPGRTTVLNENSKMLPINLGIDLAAGMNTIQKIESSVSESSNDVLQSGQAIPGSQTAFEISRLEQNAMTMLGLFGRMISYLVRDWGELRKSDILQHLTVADVDELVGDDASLKYRSFLLPNKGADGKRTNNRIVFGETELPEDDIERSKMVAMMEGGFDANKGGDEDFYLKKGIEGGTRLYLVNPSVFRSLKYKVVINPEMATPKSEAFKKALALEEFDRLISLPFIDQEAITKDLLLGQYEATKFNVDKYIKKQPEQPPQELSSPGQPAGQPGRSGQPGQSGESVLGRLYGNGRERELNKVVE